MNTSFRSGIILLIGLTLLATAAALNALVIDGKVWVTLLTLVGLALSAWGAFSLRGQLGAMVSGRRGEIALYTLGLVGVLVALAYFSLRFPMRLDMTANREHSLSEQTVNMIKRIDKPVKIAFFHDPMMRETVELYQLMAAQNKLVSLELFDPMLNPAQARLMGVQFAGTALMESEGRKLQINGPTEIDIANGILRVSQGSSQRLCFLDGHGEADPFSIESHDHQEGAAGHSHGLGDKMVIHEQHGMAKARNALEAMNYTVEKLALLKGKTLENCAMLVVAGAKTPLMPQEISAIRAYLEAGNNALFMFDPFVQSGLEPLMQEWGVVVDDTIVIDDASHFWADPSSPAVSEYNLHQITKELPLTFFPGARSLSPTSKRIPGIGVTPLINASKQSYGETTPDRAEFNEGKDLPGPSTIMAIIRRRPETAKTAATIMAELRGEKVAEEKPTPEPPNMKRSRIVVVGDSDFATNSFFHIMGNGKLFLNTINYLAAQENLIGLEPRTFDKPRVNITNRQMKGTFFLSVILIPLLLGVIGTAVWWRQR